MPYWWIGHAQRVLDAKCGKTEPIRVNSSIQIQHNHLVVIRQCWSDERESRPSVDEVLNYLLALYAEPKLASPLQTKLNVSISTNTLYLVTSRSINNLHLQQNTNISL